MSRPLALDLFCGAGGASMGLYRAGFDVFGVDLVARKRYPFDFIQADVLNLPFSLDKFDFIWASPPCHAYSVTRHMAVKERPDLVAAVRAMLRAFGGFTCIENVPGAPLQNYFKLTGAQFGLNLYRERWFECNFFMLTPDLEYPRGLAKAGKIPIVAGHGFSGDKAMRCKSAWSEAMGIDWMSMSEMALAIPPAYSEFIGRSALSLMEKSA